MSPCNVERSCITFHKAESNEAFSSVYIQYTMKDTFPGWFKSILHSKWHRLYCAIQYAHACICIQQTDN